jgi:phosphoglycolate phosphatase-like HAD superfamily hydrolase
MRRIILFDIDGTLISGGPAKHSFVDAMVETYGMPGDFERVSFAGKTDPQIARELLAGAGIGHTQILDGLDLLFRSPCCLAFPSCSMPWTVSMTLVLGC